MFLKTCLLVNFPTIKRSQVYFCSISMMRRELNKESLDLVSVSDFATDQFCDLDEVA